MTDVTLYGCTANASVSTDDKLVSVTGATATILTTKVAKASGYGEVWAKGNTGNWPGGSGPPAASDHGFMWDVTTLEGQTLTGSQAPVITLNASSSLVATIYVLISKRSSAGAFTTIGTCSLSAQTIFGGAAYTITPATFANVDFATGDKLVMNVWLNITTPSGSNTGTVGISVGNSSTQGVANCAQLTTHYIPTVFTRTRTVGTTAALSQADRTRTAGASVALSGTDWYGAGWRYQKTLTIAHGQVSGSDQTDFPVLVTFTDTDLKLAPTGKIQNVSGFDLIFLDSTGTVQLDHEIEKYDGTAGTITAWVRIPTVSASTDTLPLLLFGNALISTPQANKTGVWKNGYNGVWHLSETSGNNADSSGNGNDFTSITITSRGVAAKIAGGNTFNGTSDVETTATSTPSQLPASLTFSLWVNLAALPAPGGVASLMRKGHGAPPWSSYSLGVTSDGYLQGQWINDSASFFTTTGLSVLTTSIWYRLSLTFDTTSKIVQVYKNGVADQVSPTTASGVIYPSTDVFMLSDSGTNKLSGSLDEPSLASVVRSTDWLVTEYNNQNAPGTFVTPGTTVSVSSSAAKTRTITTVTGALLLEKTRTIPTVTSALLLEKSRPITSAASLSAARTIATSTALLVEKKNTAGSTVAFLLEKTCSITTVTGALLLEKSRTITTCTVALLVEKTNTASCSVALLLEKNRPVTCSVPLLLEKNREGASSGALSLVGSRSSTISGSLAYFAKTNTVGSSAALLIEKTHTAGSSTALRGEQARTSGGTVSLLLEKSRTATTDVALSQLGTLTRTVPGSVALSLTKRDIGSSTALLLEQSRSAGSSAAFSLTLAKSIPTSGTLVLTQSRSAGSSTTLLVQKTNACSSSVALSLLGQTHTIPVSGSLTMPGTNTRTVPASVALSQAVRSIPASLSLSLTRTRNIASSAALLITGSRSIPSGVALLASQARSIPASTSLLANRVIPGSVALLTISARNVPASADLSSGIDRTVPCSVALSRVGSRPIPASVILSLFIANARVTVPSGYVSLTVKSGAALVTIE